MATVYILFSGYYEEYGCSEESDGEESIEGIYSTEEKALEAMKTAMNADNLDFDMYYKKEDDWNYVHRDGTDQSWFRIDCTELDHKYSYSE